MIQEAQGAAHAAAQAVQSMDPHWFNMLLFIVQVLVSIVLALIGFFMRQVVLDLRTVTKELRDFQKEVLVNGDAFLRNYFEEYRKETRTRLHDFGDRIGALEGALRLLHKVNLPVNKQIR